jgi:redox-sensitive bicupin YhaK (pirin superfamily)
MTTNDLTLGAREVPLGGLRGLTVHRTLPQRGFPTIGAWCFVDHFGPTAHPMAVLPHPHTGLQTVTWPIAGEIRHRDSLGSDVVLKPGELNLMTSGDGVSHSEFSVGDPDAPMHGIQLWVALPAGTRRGAAGFEHHPDLPVAHGDGWSATVFLGEVEGAVSPATTYTPIVGAELAVRPGFTTIPLRDDFEHAILAVDGPVVVDGEPIEHRELRYLAPGRSSVGLQVPAATSRSSRSSSCGGTSSDAPTRRSSRHATTGSERQNASATSRGTARRSSPHRPCPRCGSRRGGALSPERILW